MANDQFRLTVHMVSSLDGMIAKSDNSISWFETSDDYENGVIGENPEAFLNSIDCYVMGSRTYELAEELSKDYGWAYGNKPTIVLTTRQFQKNRRNIEFYSGDLKKLINERFKPKYKTVWVVGGSMLVKEFLRQNLVDEIRVSVLPIVLGGGLPFFDNIGKELKLHLTDTKGYKNGMVELCYAVIK